MHEATRSNDGSRRRAVRWVALLGAALVVMVTGVPAGPAPAGATAEPEAEARSVAAVTGVVRVIQASASNSTSPKSVTATCPGTKKVVGGGGSVFDSSTAAPQPTLIRLQPADNGTGADSYGVTAAETQPGTTRSWSVTAYALCADAASVPGWRIVAGSSSSSSAAVQRVTPACGSTALRLLGVGARVNGIDNGEVVLQTARSDASGSGIRAQAHEDGNGFALSWSITGYAICANTPQGYQVVGAESPQSDSETVKTASATCGSKLMLSAGGAISDLAPGEVSLQRVVPDTGPNNVVARAIEHESTSSDWDFIVARGICVDRTE